MAQIAQNLANKLACFAQNTPSFCKRLIVTFVVKKNSHIFAENGTNCQNLANKLACFAQNTPSFCKRLVVTFIVKKNAHIFAKNGKYCQKMS
jgi:uncharacterized membrane protein YbaN (DUF454 family)